MKYLVTHDNRIIKGKVSLPSSKSISNRLLILKALSGNIINVENISESEDSVIMQKALKTEGKEIDVGHAGTAMRFLTAYCAVTEGERVLTGSSRMKQRPIGKLVEALRNLGASIRYLGEESYPPLLIQGQSLNGGSIEIDGNISSQYISALLLIAPFLPEGLTIHLRKKVISVSYIELTLDLLRKSGFACEFSGNTIHVSPSLPRKFTIQVEPDWSSASYWYEAVAFSSEAELFIEGLQPESKQGDARIHELFEEIGVHTEFTGEGALLSKKNARVRKFAYDMIKMPDMIQTFAVTLFVLNIPFIIHGAESLRIKETDRIHALQTELAKLGAKIDYDESGVLSWNGRKDRAQAGIPIFDTYHDHRMALAFAPLAMVTNGVMIDDPGVIVKSYPGYWDDLKNLGFAVKDIPG